jgi:hypothetical protein
LQARLTASETAKAAASDSSSALITVSQSALWQMNSFLRLLEEAIYAKGNLKQLA